MSNNMNWSQIVEEFDYAQIADVYKVMKSIC